MVELQKYCKRSLFAPENASDYRPLVYQKQKRKDRESALTRLQAARDALTRIERGESPTAEELAAAPLLNFWCVVVDPPFPVLRGVVIGHPRLADGATIGTSPLLWLAEDGSAACTVSRFYRLGVPLAEAMPRQS